MQEAGSVGWGEGYQRDWDAGWIVCVAVGDALAGSAGAEEDYFGEVVVHATEFLGGEGSALERGCYLEVGVLRTWSVSGPLEASEPRRCRAIMMEADGCRLDMAQWVEGWSSHGVGEEDEGRG